MSTQLTSTGFTIDRLDQRLANLVAAYTAIFGPFDSDPDGTDGQTIGIYGESANNLDQLAQVLYSSFDPAQATGQALSRLVTLNGLTRKAPTYGSITLALVGQSGVTVPAGSLVRSQDGTSTWSTLDDVELDVTGTGTIDAACTTIGPVLAGAGTVTYIASPVRGWQSVTNPDDATPGQALETDGQLRARRNASTAYPAQSVFDALYGALDNLDGVINLACYENPTDSADVSTDNLHGLPPHSFYAVVEGGAAQDIVNALWLKKTLGVTLLGQQTGTATDSAGNPHVMRYDTPAPVEVYLTVNLKAFNGFPSDGVAQVQQAIVNWANRSLSPTTGYQIGDNVVVSELYTPINTVPDLSVESVYAGTAANPVAYVDILEVPFNALALFDASRITVNVVNSAQARRRK